MKNEFDQPVGQAQKNWKSAKKLSKVKIVGVYSILEPLVPSAHARKLFELLHNASGGWTYLPYGPFDTYDDFYFWLTTIASSDDPFLYAILDSKNNQPLGIAGYLRVTPEHGVIEIGHLHFSTNLKKTPNASDL